MKALTRGQMTTLLVVAVRFRREHEQIDVAKFQPVLDNAIDKLQEALGAQGHDKLSLLDEEVRA